MLKQLIFEKTCKTLQKKTSTFFIQNKNSFNQFFRAFTKKTETPFSIFKKSSKEKPAQFLPKKTKQRKLRVQNNFIEQTLIKIGKAIEDEEKNSLQLNKINKKISIEYKQNKINVEKNQKLAKKLKKQKDKIKEFFSDENEIKYKLKEITKTKSKSSTLVKIREDLYDRDFGIYATVKRYPGARTWGESGEKAAEKIRQAKLQLLPIDVLKIYKRSARKVERQFNKQNNDNLQTFKPVKYSSIWENDFEIGSEQWINQWDKSEYFSENFDNCESTLDIVWLEEEMLFDITIDDEATTDKKPFSTKIRNWANNILDNPNNFISSTNWSEDTFTFLSKVELEIKKNNFDKTNDFVGELETEYGTQQDYIYDSRQEYMHVDEKTQFTFVDDDNY